MPLFIRKISKHPYTLYAKAKHLDRNMNVDVNGLKFRVNPMTYNGCSLYHRGVYEPCTTRIIEELLSPGDIAFDIGASNGVLSLPMSKEVGDSGKVYAFEPSKERFDMLQEHIKINNISNIVAEMKGVSDENTTMTITECGMVRMDGKKHEPVTNKAEIVRLDDYVKNNKIKKVDFIKIDTDGFELKILQNGIETLKKFKPVMVVEMRVDFAEELVFYLSALGYCFIREDTLEDYVSEEAVIDDVSKTVKNVLCIPKDE